MGEASVGPGGWARGLSGLSDLVYEMATDDAHAELFSVPEEGGRGDRWARVSAGAFATDVTAVAKGLVAAGVGEGDRVLLVCSDRLEWVRMAFAVWSVRAVLVPLPVSASPERVVHAVRQTRPAAAVVEGERALRVVTALQRELPDLGRVWRCEAGSGEIVSLGAYMDASSVRFRRDATAPEDAAVVLYPMSTASRWMRGVALSHGALLSAAADLVDRLGPQVAGSGSGQASALADVSLSQIQGLASLVACVVGRVRLGLGGSGRFLERVRVVRPSVLVCGSSLLEEVFEGERGSARSTGWDSLGTFNSAVEAAVQFDRSPKKGAWQRLSRSMYDWQFAKVREVLGDRARLVVCWGGALSDRLDSFYGGVGVPVMQVFGTAETAGVFAANAVGARVPGSVGRALEGREVWVSREGEAHVRGGAVFSGYWGDGEATSSAFREGWLATGVAASVDGDGFVSVSGRVRPQASVVEVPGRFSVGERGGAVAAVEAAPESEVEVEVVADADVAVTEALPAVVEPEVRSDAELVAGFEARLRSHPLISQVLVIVEGRPFASALITLVRDQLEYWRLVNGRPLSMAPEEIAGDRDLLREVQGLVYEANRSVPRHLAVRSFHVLAEEFTVQSGLVHPSGELRGDAVLRAFSEEIDGLYRVRRDQ
ncbi:AMP-binding protein [Nocardiopsis sp. N85]|uniref:AMP-binding protein n=1 Tax=Nocardiopsis sp. N85 TaxID=3029400 RepID=UPI00237F9A03|nr:AMP-binding protein [Nocardiopsis sp. N85]MDE3722819.1 AMP-binding protein [Nocardiopsis sp. N85]